MLGTAHFLSDKLARLPAMNHLKPDPFCMPVQGLHSSMHQLRREVICMRTCCTRNVLCVLAHYDFAGSATLMKKRRILPDECKTSQILCLQTIYRSCTLLYNRCQTWHLRIKHKTYSKPLALDFDLSKRRNPWPFLNPFTVGDLTPGMALKLGRIRTNCLCLYRNHTDRYRQV
jgi:hypothetical protein